jgi:hypothetical protein
LLRSSLASRERLAWDAHKDVVRGSSFPPPNLSPGGTFLHGFLLPFSLIATTLRHPTLGMSYVRLTVARVVVVTLLAVVGFQSGLLYDPKMPRSPLSIAADASANQTRAMTPHLRFEAGPHSNDEAKTPPPPPPRRTDVDADDERDEDSESQAPSQSAEKANTLGEKPLIVQVAAGSWKWLAWFFGVVSMIEGIVVTFSRRWDDWLGFHTAPLAGVRAEDPFPPQPKVSFFEPRWLFKKAKRRLRGYVVVAAGIPLVALFRLVPTIGEWLFAAGLTAWSWYWLGVFTAAKSAHAWVDDGYAPLPTLIREFRDRSVGQRWLAPVNLYARIWAWATRGLNAPASVFERNTRSFLGLALARVVLSLPGLYLLARPIVPVAAGRLCAESCGSHSNDPQSCAYGAPGVFAEPSK